MSSVHQVILAVIHRFFESNFKKSIVLSYDRKKALTFVGAFLLYLEIFCLCSAGEYDMMKLKKSSICFGKVHEQTAEIRRWANILL